MTLAGCRSSGQAVQSCGRTAAVENAKTYSCASLTVAPVIRRNTSWNIALGWYPGVPPSSLTLHDSPVVSRWQAVSQGGLVSFLGSLYFCSGDDANPRFPDTDNTARKELLCNKRMDNSLPITRKRATLSFPGYPCCKPADCRAQ